MVYDKVYTDILRSRLKGKTYCSYGTIEKDLMKGADPNQFDLILKKKKNLAGFTELLLKYGADPNKRYGLNGGRFIPFMGYITPIAMCILHKHSDALSALVNHPATDLKNEKIVSADGKYSVSQLTKYFGNEKIQKIIDDAVEKRRRQKAAKDALQQKDTRKFRLKI